MSFPRYPAYKDSGVEWLGEVPEHWEVVPVKLLAEIVNGYPFDSALFDAEEGFPLVRIRDLDKQETEARYKGEFIERAAITSDDVLIGMDGDFNVGRWCGVGYGLLNQRMCCVRGTDTLVTRLLEYALPIPLKTINDVTYSTTVKHLASAQVESIRMAIAPDAAEQTLVVSFLNRETAKIDALIDEQRRLIELLKEKRQAVINHAVIKGLDPHVRLKSSGTEWLGEVPAHWKVVRIKHVVATFEQGWSPQCETTPAEGEEWGVLKVGCVNGGTFRPTENKLLPADLDPVPALGVRKGDLLISRANTRELVGSAAVAEQDFPRLIVCDKLYRIRVTALCLSAFLSLYLGSNVGRGVIELQASGASASMLNIPQSTILEMPLPLPPLDEQRDLVGSLGDAATRLDSLTAEAARAIELLQERRTALISAAVTGKIDVRGLAEAA